MAKRPMYLQHVNIYVRNAEKSKEWYENLLGLHCYEYRPGWAAFMSADTDQSHEVAVMQLGDDAPLQQRRQVGLNHMAWRVESLDDLKEFYHADQGAEAADRPHRRSRHLARHLSARSGRQRGRGALRDAARRVAGRLPHLLAATRSAAAVSLVPWDAEMVQPLPEVQPAAAE